MGVIDKISKIIPTVVINNIVDSGGILCVDGDYFMAAFIAVEHLIQKGHKTIAYITDDINGGQSYKNISGYKAALRSAHIEFNENLILHAGRNEDVFKKRIRKFFLNKSVTAVYTRNDAIAAKIIRILREMEKKVPEEISIIGTGNYETGINYPMPLTTIDPRFDLICKKGLDLLLKKEKGKKIEKTTNVIDPVLIERETVANKP